MYKSYLTTQDYLSVIQSDQLNDQLLDSLKAGGRERSFAESWAYGQIKSKIKAKYDLDYEFTDTLPYNPKQVYYAGSRVIIDFDLWIAKSYNNFDCVINNGIGYICNVDTSSVLWDESEWQSLGCQYTLYYIPLPYQRFSLELELSQGGFSKGYYVEGDNVWWLNHTYTALRPTITIDHDTYLQFYRNEDIPSGNIFPNDVNQGKLWWNDLGEYNIQPYSEGNPNSFLIGSEDTPSVWTEGDNRDPVVMQVIMDLAIWMLHRRIAPQNIPKNREQAKDDAFGWLSNIKSAKEDTDLEPLQPSQGDSFRWGSNTKNTNTW